MIKKGTNYKINTNVIVNYLQR